MRTLPTLLACAALAAAQSAPARPALGTTVTGLRAVDIRWVPRTLADFADQKALVLFFVGKDCPIARRYLPRLAALYRTHVEQGAEFLAINCSPADTVLDMAAQAVEQDIPFPFLKDFDGGAAELLGVTRLGTAVVLDQGRVLRYRGRVDGQYRLQGAAPTPGREDLALALQAVLAGKPVEIAETEVEGCVITRRKPVPHATPPTFHKDVEPLLQRHCQDCHRKGGPAPFTLLSFDDAVDRREMIAEVVDQRRMPPWFGCPEDGPFQNQRGLSPDERAVIDAWVRAGGPRGKPEDAPPPRKLPEGEWQIGAPDLVVRTAAPFTVPAEGIVPYQYLVLPHVFAEDTWIQSIEILPESPGSLHHANLVSVQKGKKYDPSGFLTGLVPGGDAMQLDDGIACLVPKGSVFVVQAHYVTNGKQVRDRVRVGLKFPKVPVQKRLRHWQIHDNRFAIPPGAPHHPVAASRRFRADATGVGMFAHMHLRGKDMTFTAHYPDGKEERLLRVPNYSFEWQCSYHWKPGTRRFAKGTRIDVLAHFDNSPFNTFNPDPKETVKFGLETVDEMMYGFFFYTEDQESLGLSVDPKTGVALAR